MGAPEDPPLARSIGAFFGHIIDAVRTDPNAPAKAEVRRETTEEHRPDGVTLRRTVLILEEQYKRGQRYARLLASRARVIR